MIQGNNRPRKRTRGEVVNVRKFEARRRNRALFRSICESKKDREREKKKKEKETEKKKKERKKEKRKIDGRKSWKEAGNGE